MTINLDSNARTWGMLCHLSGLAGFVVPSIGSILGPLIVWLVKRQEIPFVDDQGKEALNFQITMFIGLFITGIVGGVIALVTCGLGFILPAALVVYQFVYTIIGAIRANAGEYFRYPFNLRFIN